MISAGAELSVSLGGDAQLLRAFRFRVCLMTMDAKKLCDGGFQEVSGLEIGMTHKDVRSGGDNNKIYRLRGPATYGALILKRGMVYSQSGEVRAELWRWLQATINGAVPLKLCQGYVEVIEPLLSVGGSASAGPVSVSASAEVNVSARWAFEGGLPVSLKGPALNAVSGAVAIEELQIMPRRLWLEG